MLHIKCLTTTIAAFQFRISALPVLLEDMKQALRKRGIYKILC